MNILIVDDETLVRKTLQSQIETDSSAHKVFAADSLETAVGVLEAEDIDLVLTDLTLDDSAERAGIKLLRELSERWPATVAVAMTGHDEETLVEQCLKSGAADYILKPIDAAMLRQTVRKAPVLHRLLRKAQNLRFQAGRNALKPFELRSKSPAFNTVLERARKMRGAGQSVLIRGESGAARRCSRAICGASRTTTRARSSPSTAADADARQSELSAPRRAPRRRHRQRNGKFESANGGDLFLDELATLSLEIQVKLLRALSNGEISPVGQDVVKRVKCRVITATNENLEDMIKAKTFARISFSA